MTGQQGKIMLEAALALVLSQCTKSHASFPLEFWKRHLAELFKEAATSKKSNSYLERTNHQVIRAKSNSIK